MSNYNARNISDYCRILTHIFCKVIQHNYRAEQSPVPLSKTQFSILTILKVTGPLPVSDIAKIMQISNAAASKNIDNLVNYKLISRKIVAENRRTARISLLRAGKEIVDKYEALRIVKQDAAMASLSKKEQDQLSKLLGKYVQQCLIQEKIDLTCLECDGTLSENCELGSNKKLCDSYYRIKKKNV